jgi:hypothetical protein
VDPGLVDPGLVDPGLVDPGLVAAPVVAGAPTGVGALAEVVARTRPVSLAREQTLPVLPALGGLLPDAALARGTTVAVTGASLALALAAGPSRAGSWVVLVGVPWLGLGAVAGLGLALERVAVVAPPEPAAWATVVAALVGAFDVVLVAEPPRVRAAEARRLAARARERGTVLVAVGPSEAVPSAVAGAPRQPRLEADLRLGTAPLAWEGLADGHGHLRARRVRATATGRRRAGRPRTVDLWLPGPDGAVHRIEPSTGRRSSSPVGRSPGPEAPRLDPVAVDAHRRRRAG